MHKFVITGGLGLLGRRILRHLVSTGGGRVRVMVLDAQLPENRDPTATAPLGGAAVRGGVEDELAHLSLPGCQEIPVYEAEGLADDSNVASAAAAVSFVGGDLGCSDVAAAIKSFVNGDGNGSASSLPSSSSSSLSVFHLASVMSGQGEADFDEAIRVNIDGTRSLLNTCREIGGRPRFVFASSIAAFGGGDGSDGGSCSAQVSDDTKLLPQTTYGMTKACAELLVNDCTRKGFIDGRIARLPTVIVRPGPPNPAATGCFSSVPKAILHGQHFVSPVSRDLRHPCIKLSSAVRGIIRLHDASETEIGTRMTDRAITLPAVSLTLGDLEMSALQLASELGRAPGKITYEPDDAIEAVVKAMPSAVQASGRTAGLGLIADGVGGSGALEMVNEYMKAGWLR
ncbi:unnamed protein product [Scytosiphon promiscuus]